ncbi:hypothetical protein BgiBS90_019662, partial [Biomphalaria glabrata]
GEHFLAGHLSLYDDVPRDTMCRPVASIISDLLVTGTCHAAWPCGFGHLYWCHRSPRTCVVAHLIRPNEKVISPVNWST